MHLSTSNSDPRSHSRKLDRFTIVLLATIVAVLAMAEVVSRVGFDRISKVQRRELAQRDAILTVKDSSRDEFAHVAVLGNSLLLDGVDVSLLAGKIGPKFVPAPYFVLGAEYYDWYFGLKRLFREGMHPSYVLVGLSPNQFASDYTRGDYCAHYLFQASDLLDVAQRTHMDATRTSGFVLAHFSEFYSTREVTRSFLMNRLLPQVGELFHSRFGPTRDPELNEEVLRRVAHDRLTALNELSRAQGARFILVVPPSYQKGGETIAQVGRELGIPVLVPIKDGALDSSYYDPDGFHLNDKGAQVFTSELAKTLLDDPRIEQANVRAQF